MTGLSSLQRVGLVVLRILIGWHFLYEGYYKLMLPGWTSDGQPVAGWSAAGYLKAASGPLAGLFRPLADSGASAWIDVLVPLGLLLAGLSLILGLATQAGCWGALAFLTVFYLSTIPTEGVPRPGSEGVYLLVSKNLVEWGAVLVLLFFRTGQIAGLDQLWSRQKAGDPAVPREGEAAVTAEPGATT